MDKCPWSFKLVQIGDKLNRSIRKYEPLNRISSNFVRSSSSTVTVTHSYFKLPEVLRYRFLSVLLKKTFTIVRYRMCCSLLTWFYNCNYWFDYAIENIGVYSTTWCHFFLFTLFSHYWFYRPFLSSSSYKKNTVTTFSR
jgi:hypothetical protein